MQTTTQPHQPDEVYTLKTCRTCETKRNHRTEDDGREVCIVCAQYADEMTPQPATPVIFRTYSEGDIIALFPATPADARGRYCESYQHAGQHGGADYQTVLSDTRPATKEEYSALKGELESDPYNYRLKVYRQRTPQHREEYNKEYYRWLRYPKVLQEFTAAYIECAFWADSPEGEEGDAYYAANLAPEARHQIETDAASFVQANYDAIKDNPSQAGHDFWLTRNHHGAGFWDRPELWTRRGAAALTTAAHKFPEASLYRGDDGKIHHEAG